MVMFIDRFTLMDAVGNNVGSGAGPTDGGGGGGGNDDVACDGITIPVDDGKIA